MGPVPPSGKVLQVGTYQGTKGGYSSVQAAVDAAQPGDWILIAPGTYHEKASVEAGVMITKQGLHLRGMDRNGVVIDGTNPGNGTCSSSPAAQDFGPGGSGRNGIEVVKVSGVSIENLTVCNYLGDLNGSNGNQIWWNGGDGSGVIGMGSYSGAYLTASSTFYQFSTPNLAQYGIFVSNASGPGSITHSYASNMSDSAFYVGACANCNALLRYVHAQNSAQGFSGSNAGGNLVLEDSEWDHNQAGIVPSSLANDDPPSPQDGACAKTPGNSCTIIQRNLVHDNNNPNTPAAGLAATVPVGTGIDLTGGRNNTVQYNLVTNNGSWGILLNDYPDYSTATVPAFCQGGVLDYTPPSPYDQLYAPLLPIPCYFHSFGNRVIGNVFMNNGFFGNRTNGDLANAALPYATNNCFRDNKNLQTGQPKSSPPNLQAASVAGTCGMPWHPNTREEEVLTEELGCASIGLCTGLPLPLNPLPSYPVQTEVRLLPIPVEKGMADPCLGVPANSWCTK
jgi:parallel beta-helix repeat protein